MPEIQPKKRHLRADRFHRDALYKSKKRGSSSPVPTRTDFRAHGQALVSEVQKIEQYYTTLAQSWEGNENIHAKGISIELEIAPGVTFDIERLETGGWQLLNERMTTNNNQLIIFQTWFVPDGKLGVLASIVGDYLSKTRKIARGKDKGKLQPKYRPLVDAIERIGKAAAQQLWTERDELFPEQQTLWFEVWIRRGSSEAERAIILQQFLELSQGVGIKVGNGRIKLPEHTIVAAYGLGSSFSKDLALLSCVAELRRGRDYADFFDALRPDEQAAWAKELLQRVNARNPDGPYISVLDTGVNRGHPLLDHLIPEADNLTINADWSAADDDEHGTLMAGLCLFGDMTLALASTGKIDMPVNVEGVKIVPPPAQRGTDEKLAGAYTAQGVGLAETHAPKRKRVWCVATSMKEPNDPIPTSWSAQMDALACGLDNDGQARRLLCLSAGNIPSELWKEYPDSNHKYSVENPAQSWNALCVGAFTDFHVTKQPDSYRALASRGALAPSSSTSLQWETKWPNKPDVVFEGGNAGFQEANNSTLNLPELSLLSTHADFNNGAFGLICGTSPATALASRMAGRIMLEYPELTPETIRGLIIHSADWTDAMKASIPNGGLPDTKRERANFLLRTVGYGVPSLTRALDCAKNRATMIAECEIQPFKIDKKEIGFNHMHLHKLPWPATALKGNSQQKVKMRVTLSYFIEPNPGNRGYTSNFRYASCALRFKVSSPNQTEDDLAAQVSKLASDEFKQQNRVIVGGSNDGWVLGQACFRGSIHSDTWEGTAANLLSMQHIAVSPVTGWWRTRPSHERGEARLKYSLIVSLEAENPELDIYTEIENQIKIPITV
jgi:hypothetical protein